MPNVRSVSLFAPRIARGRLVTDLCDPAIRLVRLTAPAGYGKSILARSLLERAGSQAICDLAYVTSSVSLARSIVESASIDLPKSRRDLLPQEYLALGSDDDAWRHFASSFLATVERPLKIAFESGEAISGNEEITFALEHMLQSASPNVSVIVCSRIEPGLRLGRFSGPDATRLVGSSELRFDRDEIARVFAGIATDRATLDLVEAFTRGWPIVVMMLYMLAKRGRLDAYLRDDADVSNLYGYLADEVYRFLSVRERGVLEAIAAIPDAMESDLAVLFPNDYLAPLETLERDTPFVARRPGGGIEVHPAMRQMLARRGDPDAVLQRLYLSLERRDGGLRAARIALHRHRPEDTARALSAVEGGYFFVTPTPDLNAILSELPDEILVRYPELWNFSTLARAFTRDPVDWIDEGERVLAALRREAPARVHAGVVGSLANAYLNRGRFRECEEMVRRFAAQAESHFASLAALVRDFWLMTIDAYSGKKIDLSDFAVAGRFEAFMQAPGTRALIEYDLVARQQRLIGTRSDERATSARAIDVALATRIPIVEFLCIMDASFGAWFAGEDALHARYLVDLENVCSPSVERGGRHYIACARGAESRTPVGTEKMKTRAYAFTIAASLARDRVQRERCAEEAVVAADHSAQPFAQVIARVALALIEPRIRVSAFDEALQLAETTCSPALRAGVAGVRTDDPRGTMLEAFAGRFALQFTNASQRESKLTIRLVEGDVLLDQRPVAVSDREMELLTLLALAGRVLDSDAVIERMWPGIELTRAATSLKTYASRVRARLKDSRAIIFERNGYRLGLPYSIQPEDAIDERCLARRVRQWDWLPSYLLRRSRPGMPASP